jgi:hypothetical protein
MFEAIVRHENGRQPHSTDLIRRGLVATCTARHLERMICSRQIEGFSKVFSEAARRHWSFGPSVAFAFHLDVGLQVGQERCSGLLH